MSNFLSSSVGKKVIMSLSGFFLMLFLCIHLTINLFLIIDNSGNLFNQGAHFMTNPAVRIIEPILAIGVIVHIVYAFILTIQNYRARPVRYVKSAQAGNCTWASRNMFILGGMILIFLVIHIYNFWWKMKITGDPSLAPVVVNGTEMENTYALVTGLFHSSVAYCLFYILGAVLLGLHLSHGFWSAFQSIGFSKRIWRKRLSFLAIIYAVVIGLGFAIIPLFFLLGLDNL